MNITKHKKEQNVKEFLILFLIIILSASVYAQKKISGTFLIDYELMDFGRSFSFENNGTFNTESSGSLGVESYGMGHYLIRNDTLILNYDLTKLKENSYHKYKFYDNLKDSILIRVNVLNLKNKTLSGVLVASIKDRYGVKTDENGIVFLKFKKQKGQKKIDISSLCCESYSLFINSENNYEIEIFLKEEFSSPIAFKGAIVKYKILKLTKEEIKLKTENSFLLLKRKN